MEYLIQLIIGLPFCAAWFYCISLLIDAFADEKGKQNQGAKALVYLISSIGLVVALAVFVPSREDLIAKKEKGACFQIQKDIYSSLKLKAAKSKDGYFQVIDQNWSFNRLASENQLKGTHKHPRCEPQFVLRSDKVGNVWCLYHGSFRNERMLVAGGDLKEEIARGTDNCMGIPKKPKKTEPLLIEGPAKGNEVPAKDK